MEAKGYCYDLKKKKFKISVGAIAPTGPTLNPPLEK